jgi:AAA domain
MLLGCDIAQRDVDFAFLQRDRIPVVVHADDQLFGKGHDPRTLRRHRPRRSAARLVAHNPEPPPAWFLSKREFISGFVAPDYLLDGILQRRFIYALTAQTGHGKTAFALLIARLVGGSDPKAALGKHPAEKGQVVYFAGENPDDLRMRVLGDTALCEDDAARIWFIPGTFSIEAMREKIEAEIKRLGGVDLVIIDTSAAYFNGKDELSNTEMARMPGCCGR